MFKINAPAPSNFSIPGNSPSNSSAPPLPITSVSTTSIQITTHRSILYPEYDITIYSNGLNTVPVYSFPAAITFPATGPYAAATSEQVPDVSSTSTFNQRKKINFKRHINGQGQRLSSFGLTKQQKKNIPKSDAIFRYFYNHGPQLLKNYIALLKSINEKPSGLSHAYISDHVPWDGLTYHKPRSLACLAKYGIIRKFPGDNDDYYHSTLITKPIIEALECRLKYKIEQIGEAGKF